MKNLLARFQRKATPAADAPVPPKESPKEKAAPIEPARMQTAVARAVKPAWHAPGAAFPQKGRTPALTERASATEMFTLQLGDFLDRIPAELLEEGTPDRTLPMPFELAVLSERIGRGDTSIRLSEVYRRMPDIFRTDRAIDQDRTIPFPWKKVLAMMQEVKAGAATDSGVTSAGVDTLAQKFKARKLRQPGKVAPPAGGADAAENGSAAQGGAALRLAAAPGPLSLVKAEPADGTPADEDELARLTAERDAALARVGEFDAEYESMIGRTGELTAERDAALARAETLAAERDAALALAKTPAEENAAAALRLTALLAERDAALARAEKLFADSEAAVALASELTAERDAAKGEAASAASERETALAAERSAAAARIAEITAERDAATARISELTAAHEAALALAKTPAAENRTDESGRVAELTAERDAAVARAEKLFADSEAAVTLATELTKERDAAQTQAGELTAAREAAARRADELTAERDAACARVTELLQKGEALVAAAPAPVEADADAAVVGFRNTIAALIRERDELRAENLQLAGKRTKRSLRIFVGKNAPVSPAPVSPAPVELLPDVYSALFPRSLGMQRAAAIVVLGLLTLGVASQITPEVGSTQPAPAAPAQAQVSEKAGLAVETTAGDVAAPGISSETPAQETTDDAQPAEGKTVTSRRVR